MNQIHFTAHCFGRSYSSLAGSSCIAILPHSATSHKDSAKVWNQFSLVGKRLVLDPAHHRHECVSHIINVAHHSAVELYLVVMSPVEIMEASGFLMITLSRHHTLSSAACTRRFSWLQILSNNQN